MSKIKLLANWGMSARNDILDLGSASNENLINRGIAETVNAKKDLKNKYKALKKENELLKKTVKELSDKTIDNIIKDELVKRKRGRPPKNKMINAENVNNK